MAKCAIPLCSDPCRSGQLMCRWHWAMVPAGEKRQVNETWREVNARPVEQDRTAHDFKVRMDRIRLYRAARDVAVAGVCRLLGLKP